MRTKDSGKETRVKDEFMAAEANTEENEEERTDSRHSKLKRNNSSYLLPLPSNPNSNLDTLLPL